MSPATMTADEQQQTVEEHRERLEEIRAALEEARERKEELDDQISEAELARDTERADQLREERREAAELVEDLEGVVPKAREQVAEAEQEARRQRARERIQEIVNAVGGLNGEYPRRLEAAKEAIEELERAFTAACRTWHRQKALATEVEILADEFDLDRPDLQTVTQPRANADLQEIAAFDPGAVLSEAEKDASYVHKIGRKWAQGNRETAVQEIESFTDGDPALRELILEEDE